MKYKLLRLSLLSVLVMLCGGGLYAALRAVSSEIVYTFQVPKNGSNTDYTKVYDVTIDGLTWSVPGNQSNEDGLRLGGKSITNVDRVITGKSAISQEVGKIVINHKGNTSDNLVLNSITMTVASDADFTNITDTKQLIKDTDFTYEKTTVGDIQITPTGEKWDANSFYKFAFNITNSKNSNYAFTIVSINFYGYTDAVDNRTETSITLVNPTTTAGVGDVVALPSAELKAADESNITDAVITWENSDETVAKFEDNTETGMKELKALKAGTATITAKYAGNATYKPCEKSFTLTVKEYTQYTTIASMLANYTTTQDVKYSFTGLSVTYVNGKYTYIHKSDDGDILLYCNAGASGLEAEAVYNGYIVGQLKSQNGLPELYVASADDIHVEKQQGMVMVDIAVITLDQLPNYINKQCAIQNAEYVSANNKNLTFKVGTSEFIAYNAFGTSTDALEAGKKYTVEGFGSVYNDTYQIYPTNFYKEPEPVVFQDFEITNEQLSGALDTSTLPACVTFSGIQRNDSHGYGNVTLSVVVNGPVKFTIGGCQYTNQTFTVKNAAGETLETLNPYTGKCYHQDKSAITYEYKGEATTLTFATIQYLPYFKAEAFEPEQKLYIAGDNTSTGWCTDNPDEMTFNAETQKFEYVINCNTITHFTITTGKTETANDWDTFGTYRLGIGAGDQDVTTDTEYQLANYSNGTFVLQGNGQYLVSVTSDLKMTITMIEPVYVVAGWLMESQQPGFFGASWNPTLEANQMEKQEDGTYKKVWNNAELPVGTIEYKIVKDGNIWIPGGDNLTYSITEAGNYDVTVTFNPQTEEANMIVEANVPYEPVVLIWDYTEANIPTKGPDNGLYYEAYVNDASGTNNGMHGVKLNSSGYAYFAKPAVAGKLTLTIGNRKTADAFAVNVYACTIADGVATKGDLIGEVAVAESPGTGSIDIAADVTGIYIERKTSAEGVLSKIVFKEIVPRKFVDFEIPYETLTADGYTGADLPTGVTFSGSFHDGQHGYSNASLVVPVDGTVKFQISGCRYGGTFDVKNADGNVLASLNQKDAGCYNYDNPGVLTYLYVGEATTLTFANIPYLSYFKAEATEVQEAVITYKDQNGVELGTKTVYEGDAIGEIPYTEADLTIPDGKKFRGWVYTSKIKVKPTDIVTGNVSILASVTPIEEAPTVGSIQTYDLTQATFYPEDHENFSVENGAYYNNHGFDFAAGGSFTVATTGKAQIVLNLCQYGSGTTIQVTNAVGTVVSDNVPAKAETDGGTTVVNYEGPAGTLKFTFAAQTYLHKVTVYNVSDFLAKDESGYYIVPAGDAAGLVLALNAAAAEKGTKIFLPNGTYDFGEATLTGISGENVSIIGQSADKTIIVNRPPRTMEGLEKADLFLNTSTGLYLQDVTLQNAMESLGNDERAATLHDKGTKTINKNVRHLSHQDTYYSHKVGGLYYFEGGEMHGTVDYLCGNGKVYFNEVKLVNEKRSSSTITANSELYVFNNCVVENNADQYNFGRAWSDHPVCIFLNTTLMDPSKLIDTRWNLSGINCDYSIAGEYGTKNAEGQDITPASNEVTFTKENTTLQTILTAEQAATYTMEYVLGDWAATAKQEATQLDAPLAEYKNGVVTIQPANNGAIAYMIEKNGEFVAITTEFTYAIDINAENDILTIRSANGRGGFGPAAQVAGTATSIQAVNAAMERGEQVIYNLSGQRVNRATKGLYIINGKKIAVK